MILASPDGQWVAARRDREVVLLAGGGVAGRLELPDGADLALAGTPDALVVVAGRRVALHVPPYLDVAAQLELDAPMRLVGATGSRLALASADGTAIAIVRVSGRALAAQTLEPAGVVEAAVGLDRNQLLLVMAKKLEVWDAVSTRPLLRLGLQLPPAPRAIGGAAGHVWATRSGGSEVFVYRLSDGRPFRHDAGAVIEAVVAHPASPVIVLVTAQGLVRLHCFAHSLVAIDAPWRAGEPLAQLVRGDEPTLVGLRGDELWRVSLASPSPAELDKRFDTRVDLRSIEPPVFDEPAIVAAAAAAPSIDPRWRDALATYGTGAGEPPPALPTIAPGSELAAVADMLALSAPARRAIVALYGAYLVGRPAIAIAQLARTLDDWREPLGQGELAGWLRRRDGTVALHPALADALDGAAPRACRIVGDRAAEGAASIARTPRAGRGEAPLEAELVERFGRVAVVTGSLGRAVREARVRGAIAVVLAAPAARPALPDGARLLVVYDEPCPAWLSELAIV